MQIHNGLAPAHAIHPAALFGGPPPARSQRLAALGHCLMQRTETPLFVTDAAGTVLEANPAATRRIEGRQGLWLDAAGRLALRQGGRWMPLAHWQPELAAGREVVLLLEADAGNAGVQITLRAMTAAGSSPADTAWVLATIEAAVLARIDAMRRRFRFTRTQARLAEMLCEGMRPTHAAEKMGVKISTVRTHVGQMYEKTGTHTQAQLVALLHAP